MSCPHRGVPLTLGFHDEEGIICPYHGLRFGEDGRCNRIPSSPNQPIPAKLNLTCYAAEERYGLVWVCLDYDADNPPQLPTMPHWADDGFQQLTCPAFEVNGFAGRQVEGFLDVAHFAWIHTDTFADADNQQVPDYLPEETENGFVVDYWSTVGNYPASAGYRAPEGFQWLRRFEMHLPFTATLTIHFPRRSPAGNYECRLARLITDHANVCPYRPQFRPACAGGGSLRLQPSRF